MNKSKKLLIVAMVGISCVIICPSKTKAALQSNGGTPASYNVNSWITGIRQMQATGQALGLTDEINGTNLTSTNTNLDIHMQKNTEYGAMVLLSSSAYGKPDKVNDGETTTGNKTGVVMKINQEWVAAVPSNTEVTSIANAVGRYKNYYTAPTYTEKIGDGVATAGAWHGASGNTWLSIMQGELSRIGRCVLLRSYSGSIFSYYGYGDASFKPAFEYQNPPAFYSKLHPTRAVVVVGSGI